MISKHSLFKVLKSKFSIANAVTVFLTHPNIYILCSLLFVAGNALATDYQYIDKNPINIDRIYVYTSFYTKHFSPDPDHVNDQDMFGIELRMTNKRMYGFTKFNNSFGQDSEYLYTGYKWNLSDAVTIHPSNHYFKLTGGLLHGYKDEYQDKIPFNGLGVAPAIVPTYGYLYKNYTGEVSLGGISVATITIGYVF